ncbi:hypothetical protein FJ973_29590 [Mesorhizobium sp. B2-1-3]|uniref:hypothetical protein n=1 Tax=Mesorhizobium sp. B2-1-3 TaxID=2589972 RepID=UPI00112D89BD|nr:hypothetical protein [Mesorhizobium sp. B2-1-3]TPN03799.1 hypothetical protein FJ973_29590 [Mesorhizobium sp. B2-1-3]
MWTPDPSIIITAAQKAEDAQAALLATFQSAIQSLVDQTAASRSYADGNALASYVASTVPAWSAEATTFVAWRDAVWVYAYGELDKVSAGAREVPTVEAFLAELPVVAWPVITPQP